MFCKNCGAQVADNTVICPNCGTQLQALQVQQSAKNKVAAGILGILLGSLGIHKFYLGYTKEGLIMLIVSIVGAIVTFGIAPAVMEIIGLIEGIIYLCKSDAEFDAMYVQNHKGWF